MTKAYSYVRFSSKAQADGASLNRQLTLCREFAKKHNLDLDETHMDLGVSAYKGANVIDGSLGLFIQAVEEGRIPRGSYLLVESLDRLSRNVVLEAQALFNKILSLDIIIATLLDEQIFSKTRINEDGGMSIMISIMYMLRAHDESKKKSQRVRDGWEKARNTKKIITKVIPSWLKIVDDHFEVIEEVANNVRLLFKMASEGKGSVSIANHFNSNGIKTLGPAEEWSPALVLRQLRNQAVIGQYETAKVQLREDYYPSIIDKDAFYNVQQLITARNLAPTKYYEGQGNIANIFAGRTYCGICGAKMKTSAVAMSRFIKNPDADRHYLICEKAYGLKTCTGAKRVPYAQFEETLLYVLIEMQHRNVFDLKSEIEYDPRPALQEEIKAKEAGIEKHMDFMMKMPESQALMKRLGVLEKELDELRKKLASSIPVKTTQEGLEDVLDVYYKFKELKKTPKNPEYKQMRSELQVGLRRVVAKLEFHHKPPEGNTHFYRITFQSKTVREWYYDNVALVG